MTADCKTHDTNWANVCTTETSKEMAMKLRSEGTDERWGLLYPKCVFKIGAESLQAE